MSARFRGGLRLMSTVVRKPPAPLGSPTNQWRQGTCYDTHASAMRLEKLKKAMGGAEKADALPMTPSNPGSSPMKVDHKGRA